ncbi:hypothetical protein ACFC26_44295 [Kitasatospora purpeofusca]|uniref:hypothetical protein n=1 Tax=Kitasatospora purpeofusca TaxID=67352 RepID=UPI0035DFBC82
MALAAVHHWIVVLDIEDFSSRPDPIQGSLRRAMYEVLHEALEQAGVPAEAVTTEDRGDGILILVGAGVPPVLLAGQLLRALDDGLREKAAFFSAAHAMRFRVALHQGVVGRDAEGWSGDAVNRAFRLVDAQPLRVVLAAAERARLVFVVSDEVYQGVIRHDHRTIDPAAYLPVDFEAKHGLALRGWITVPGYPSPPGLDAPFEEPVTAARAGAGSDRSVPPAAAAPSVVFHAGVVHGDQVAGDKHVHHAPGRLDRR